GLLGPRRCRRRRGLRDRSGDHLLAAYPGAGLQTLRNQPGRGQLPLLQAGALRAGDHGAVEPGRERPPGVHYLVPAADGCAPMIPPGVTAYLDRHAGRFVEELKEFLRIPSISTSSEHSGDIRQAAQFVAGCFGRMGVEATLEETGGHPAVVGSWLGA